MSRFQRRGIRAEAEIRRRLVLFSTPAKPEPDQGIDFFCQISDDFSVVPRFFGVQAKGTRRFKESWRGSFPKRAIERWLGLPFPVFVIVHNEDDDICYWMSVTHNLGLLVSKLRKNVDAKTIRIEVNKSHVLEEAEEAPTEFIEAVKDAQMRISLIHGRPEFGETYVREVHYYILPKQVIGRLKDHIRDSMNYLIHHYLRVNNRPEAYSLCKLLTDFDKSHYDHFWLFARMNRLKGMEEEALRNYEKAIEILRGDTKWDKLKSASQPSTAQLVALIKKEKRNPEIPQSV